ncbi:hypothetical protein KBX06_25215 [Micromonospora sp. C31]|uniref:hypothetical protein n=1 Tax=Micromonospora sp. C31 TaxID=2824876 RepID=UPI001B369BED|nr:hypothetical protein [Micromonospora sp. C31]MBQ1076429.1 hypothetical protein [Micromonospora sp. C31]
MTDPFATPMEPGPEGIDVFDGITNGATVLSVERHPIYGTICRCRGWMAHYPWTARRRDSIAVIRGDTWSSPVIGHARVAQLRRNRAEVKQVPVGFGSGDAGEPEFELVLDRPVPMEVGDVISFDAPHVENDVDQP